MLIFSGTSGQRLGLGVSAVTTTPSGGSVSVQVYKPDGTSLTSCSSYGSSGGNCNLTVLPTTGTYIVRVSPPGTSSATATLTLSSEVTGTLVANGASSTFATTRIGQDARYSFSGTAGQNVSVVWNGATFPGTWTYITVYKPDGTQLNSSYFGAGYSNVDGRLDLVNLPATGTYTVYVDPYGASTGQVTLSLKANATGTLAIDGATTAVTLAAGQSGDYSFSGTSGQRLGLGVSAVTTTPTGGSVSVQVYKPDGTSLTSCSSYGSSGGNCNLTVLPTTGTYIVRVSPPGTSSATATLTLSSEVTGTLVANAAASTFATTRIGQDARYSFSGTAGQNVSVVWNGATFPGTWTYITVYKPDGTQLNSSYFGAGYSNVDGRLDLVNLPATGTYTVYVDPYGASTGQVTLSLKANATGTLAIDGATTAVTLAAGQSGDYSFSGTSGQRLGLGVSAVTTTPTGGSVSVQVYKPDGTSLMSCSSYGSSGGNCNLPALPTTGTYIVRVSPPGTSSATATLTLSSEVTGTLVANAAASTFATTRIGQDARYSFSGTAGQNVSVVWNGATFPGTWTYITIYKPDGTQLNSSYFGAGYSNVDGRLDLVNLPATGTYTVYVDPYGASTGQVTLSLKANATGTLAIDGATTAVTLAAGQSGDYSFSGTSGQRLGLGVSAVTTTPTGGSVSVQVYKPDGTSLTSCSSYGSSGGNCNLPALPTTGTYIVRVSPPGTSSATATLTLSSEVTGTLVANAAASTFATTRIGQDARYSFSGTAGQNVSVVWNGGTFPGTWTYITIYKPDGTQLNSSYFGAGYSNVDGRLDLVNLPTTGTYTVYVDPYGASTGQVTLSLKANATGTLAIDGATTAVTLAAGQSGDYSFSGTSGQRLGLGVSAVTTTPSGGSVSVQVYKPDGTSLMSCSSYGSSGGNCNLPALPTTGTYIVRVSPPGTSSATATLTLSSEVTGTLVANAAASTFATTRIGQDARYSFSGTAGQNVSVVWNGGTFPGTWTYITIYKPDGTQLNSSYFGAGYSNVDGRLDLVNLPATGTYTVYVDPYGASTGQVTLSLKANATGTLAIDGATTAVTLAAGQSGDYSFSGTSGQRLGLGVSAVTTTPSGGSVSVQVYKPDGTSLTSCSSYSTGGNCNLTILPTTGTYIVRVSPPGTSSATATLTLSSEVTGTLVANAAASTFSTTRIGQDARYSFSGTAGQNVSVVWNGATFPGTWTYITIYKPDGTQLNSSYFGAGYSNVDGRLDLVNLPATGTYTVYVDPYGTSTGQVTLSLKANAMGTLAIDGATTAVTLAAGQSGDYSFSGTSGQRLGLGVSAVTTTPTGGSVSVQVYKPDGTSLTSCSSYSTGGNCNLTILPTTGTYIVRVSPPGTSSATATLTLSSEVTGTLVANAAASTFATTRIGQDARYSFSGTAGQNVSVVWNGATFPGTWTYITVYKPDGTQLNSSYFGAGYSNVDGRLDLVNLPATGTYTVYVDPYGASTGQVTLSLKANATGTLAIDGATTAVTLAAGQSGDYSFSGTSGQRLGLGVSAVTTTPTGGSVSVQVYKPDGTSLMSCSSYGSSGGNCNLPALPTTGTYIVRVSPPGTSSATATLTLSSEVTGTLVANAAASTFSTTRIGQDARYSFSGTAGQNVSVVWNGATFPGTWTYITIYKPDGTQLNSSYFGAGYSNVDGRLDLVNLPATGTYTVYVDPYGASTGQVTLSLKANATGTLAIDGATTAVTLAAGQSGDYSFSGTSGQRLGLGVSAVTTTPSGGSVSVQVYKPDGTSLTSCSSYSTGGNCNLTILPTTGTYIVRVSPPGTSSATATLTLSSEVTGTLVANAAASTFATTRIGQDARYSFSGTAGQNVSVVWNGATFPGTWTYITIYKPDGTQLNSSYFGAGYSNVDGRLDLVNLPATGTYTVYVDPYGASTGQVTLSLKANATGTLAIDGATTAVTLAAGQSGDYSFSGTSGQRLGLGVSAVTTTPSGGSVSVQVYKPDGTSLTSCSSYSTGGNCNLTILPTTGTYIVRVSPPGTSSATATLTLSSEVTGTLVANAAASTFSTTRIGQDARYSFSGTAGQNASVVTSGSTFASAGYVTIYKPDGTSLNSGSFGGTITLTNLPVSGTYTVFVDPYAATTGTINLALR
ncbi:MAG: hypothetical protein QM749_16175 [Aquabacterium sp.]